MQLQDALKTIGEASYRLKKFGELSSIGSYDMTATAPNRGKPSSPRKPWKPSKPSPPMKMSSPPR